jgi:hypothetical protein
MPVLSLNCLVAAGVNDMHPSPPMTVDEMQIHAYLNIPRRSVHDIWCGADVRMFGLTVVKC